MWTRFIKSQNNTTNTCLANVYIVEWEEKRGRMVGSRKRLNGMLSRDGKKGSKATISSRSTPNIPCLNDEQ